MSITLTQQERNDCLSALSALSDDRLARATAESVHHWNDLPQGAATAIERVFREIAARHPRAETVAIYKGWADALRVRLTRHAMQGAASSLVMVAP